MSILEKIKSTHDLKKLSLEDLDVLAGEIRTFLIEKVSKTGGHLASNLGAVELTIALLRVFDAEYDRIVWDVGHQSYTYKILTGRKDMFDNLRQKDGLSGFPKTTESCADAFNTGHSSTSISLALGFAAANKIKGENKRSIAVIGDGALTGGLAFEAINNTAETKLPLIIILNDNGMAISENTGGLSKYLKKFRNDTWYFKTKSYLKGRLENSTSFGKGLVRGLRQIKNFIKKLTLDKELFETLGLKYYGPIDGHDIRSLIGAFEYVKKSEKPLLVHVKTVKGKGYSPAEKSPGRFHGIGKFDPETGEAVSFNQNDVFSDLFGKEILKLADENEKVLCITAAMPESTGLLDFATKYPDRFFDCGIAEEHAVTFSAAAAQAGLTPVFAVYSTFLQRAYDQILHDAALTNQHVVFAIDRAGAVGQDGETHQGIYDFSYLSHIPNMVIMAPSGKTTFKQMLSMAVNELDSPVAVRYPRGEAFDCDIPIQELEFGKASCLTFGDSEKTDAIIVSIGTVLKEALDAAQILKIKGISSTVIDARFLKPFDETTVRELSKDAKVIVSVEDNVTIGGLSDTLRRTLNRAVLSFGYADEPLHQGKISELREKYGITGQNIAEKIVEELKKHE